jgi:hypothetical protein
MAENDKSKPSPPKKPTPTPVRRVLENQIKDKKDTGKKK